MNILTLSYEFPPIGGGGSGVVKGLAAELIRAGHRVEVVTMAYGDLPSHELVDGIEVHRVPCRRNAVSKCTAREAAGYVAAARPMVRRLLEINNYDLVHTHFIFPDGVIALTEVASRGIPFIITAHGSDVPGYNPKLFFKLVHPVLMLLWRRVTNRAAEIISPSRTLAELIEKNRPGTPVRVIPNGMDTGKYEPSPKKKQILVATRLVERKGVQYLLRALAGGAVGWPTVVVGSGEFEAELHRLNEELGQPARFVGWMDNASPEFRRLLQESAVYALPSDFENFPVALLEAMAAGSAILTTRGHGCEEVVGDCAELVTPGATDPEQCVREIREALGRLTGDWEYCLELGRRARQRLEDHFAWPSVARKYMDIYERHRIRAASGGDA